MPWNSKEIVERKCSVGLQHPPSREHPQYANCKHAADTSSRVITIRCHQVLGEKDMVPVLYSIPWSDSLPALCGESVHLESEVGRQDLSWIFVQISFPGTSYAFVGRILQYCKIETVKGECMN